VAEFVDEVARQAQYGQQEPLPAAVGEGRDHLDEEYAGEHEEQRGLSGDGE